MHPDSCVIDREDEKTEERKQIIEHYDTKLKTNAHSYTNFHVWDKDKRGVPYIHASLGIDNVLCIEFESGTGNISIYCDIKTKDVLIDALNKI